MADTGKRIGPTPLAGTATTLYTVPSATAFFWRTFHCCNESGSAATLTLSIGTDGAGKRLFKDYPVPANGVLLETMLITLAAGEVVQAFCATGANLLTATLSGVESA